MSSQPPSGFVHLVLLSQETQFYLEIPTAIVTTVCLSPRKYLRYLGWCVLGDIGVLKDEQGNVIALDGELVDQGVYHHNVPDQNVLAHAIDLEVIRQRSQVSSGSTTGTCQCEDFHTRILQRDGYCVWTGLDWAGMHIIIPFRRGDEWLQCIIDNRLHDGNLDSLTTSINDIRNGIWRHVVVLKTPNSILQTTDILHRCQRRVMKANVSYATNRLTIYSAMDHYPEKPVYPGSISKQQ